MTPCPRSNCSHENCANLADGSPDVAPNFRFGVAICYVSGQKPKDVYRDPKEAIRKAADDIQKKKDAKASRKARKASEREAAEPAGDIQGDLGQPPTRLRALRKRAKRAKGA